MKEINRIITDKYGVHLFRDNNTVNYIVYLVNNLNPEGVYYYDSQQQIPDNTGFREDNYVKMKGSLSWRGVWEDRYYMVDEEYWYGELKELSDLYTNYIEPYCKNYLRELNPSINE